MATKRTNSGAVNRVDIGRFKMRFKGRLTDYHRGIMIRLFRDVVYETPVDIGRLRGNWQFTKESPATEQLDLFDKEGSKTIEKIIAGVTSEVQPGDRSYFLTNNLPYANRIEYEGWSHIKAPAGMVRTNLVRIVKLLAAKHI